MRLATVTVLASRERVTEMPTLGLPLRRLKPESSAKPSSTVATCPGARSRCRGA
jgi:hypothetical protein